MKEAQAAFWDSANHRAFVESLSIDRVEALRDLMLIGALVDEIFTIEERLEVARALHDLPGLEEDSLAFEDADTIDHVDDLYARYHAEGDALLQELLARLGDNLDLSHALEAVVVLMSTNNTERKESLFARRLGVLMDVPDEFVDDLLRRYGWQV